MAVCTSVPSPLLYFCNPFHFSPVSYTMVHLTPGSLFLRRGLEVSDPRDLEISRSRDLSRSPNFCTFGFCMIPGIPDLGSRISRSHLWISSLEIRDSGFWIPGFPDSLGFERSRDPDPSGTPSRRSCGPRGFYVTVYVGLDVRISGLHRAWIIKRRKKGAKR